MIIYKLNRLFIRSNKNKTKQEQSDTTKYREHTPTDLYIWYLRYLKFLDLTPIDMLIFLLSDY